MPNLSEIGDVHCRLACMVLMWTHSNSHNQAIVIEKVVISGNQW